MLANDARFLDEMSGGRFTLGLGTGTRRMMTDWHGVPDPDGPAGRIEVSRSTPPGESADDRGRRADRLLRRRTKAYGPVMEAAGFGREAAAVRDAFRADDYRAMIEAVSDAMLDEMAVAGTADEVRDALPAVEQRYDHAALYSPSFTLTPERVAGVSGGVVGGFGGVDASGRSVPDQDARFGLFQPPAVGLLTAMMMAAQRAVVTRTSSPRCLARGGLY